MQSDAVMLVSFNILQTLLEQEHYTQNNGNHHPLTQSFAISRFQRAMCKVQRDTGDNQDSGVPEGQVAQQETGALARDVETGLRCCVKRRIRVTQQGPCRLELRPQINASQTFFTFATQPRHRQLTGVEQRTEERSKQHGSREDEPSQAPFERALYLGIVQTGMVLLDHCFEPLEYNNHENTETGPGNDRRQGGAGASSVMIENAAEAGQHHQNTERQKDRELGLFRYIIRAMGAFAGHLS